jgi:hypothetical protein
MRRSLMGAAILGASLLPLAPANIAVAAPANLGSQTMRAISMSDPGGPGDDERTFQGGGRTRDLAIDSARNQMQAAGCREEGRPEVQQTGRGGGSDGHYYDYFEATIRAECGDSGDPGWPGDPGHHEDRTFLGGGRTRDLAIDSARNQMRQFSLRCREEGEPEVQQTGRGGGSDGHYYDYFDATIRADCWVSA